MRFLLRLVGTWLLGMALVLVIIDGTKSLAANALVVTSLSESWRMVHAPSLAGFEQWIFTGPAKIAWEAVIAPALNWPGWAVLGLAGIVLAFLGRLKGNRVRDYTQV